ncbi:WxL protein peptidoglycan domain-containing protein [Oceanobacillus salinisoli]|uniref:WxL protein peptidoglycan domain-containing protein n=1 Tax=Oceanobacillus salinisoli TaxID=2678611 RepID=UPI0012E1858E|nr:DUF916 domain-containing protein [Oceanobacillus salinisoli]
MKSISSTVIFSCLSVVMLFLFGMSDIAFAQEENLPLMIEPIYPENHNPETVGYFDLSVNQGERQTLEVRITNQQDKEVLVSIKPANAFTHPSGGIIYENDIDSPDTRLLENAVRVAEYITVDETVTIPPRTSISIPIDLHVPEVEGQTFLGGILFTTYGEENENQEEVEDGTANFVIKTETVHAVAVQMNLVNEVGSDFLLGNAGFIPETAQVYSEMTNHAQKIQDGITGTYFVTDGEGNELFSGKFGPFNMAPNTAIRFPIRWGHEMLEDGKYTLHMEGLSGDKTFESSETFTIENSDVEKYVEHTQTDLPQAQIEKGIPMWGWVIGAVLFGLIMFFIGRRRQ